MRGAEDALAVAGLVVATGLAATTWGVLQVIGLVSNFDRRAGGRRMPSFAGYHDFAILSALSLALALGAIALGHPRYLRPTVWLAAVSGVLGIAIAGALSTALGVLIGIAFAVVAMIRREEVDPGANRRPRRDCGLRDRRRRASCAAATPPTSSASSAPTRRPRASNT